MVGYICACWSWVAVLIVIVDLLIYIVHAGRPHVAHVCIPVVHAIIPMMLWNWQICQHRLVHDVCINHYCLLYIIYNLRADECRWIHVIAIGCETRAWFILAAITRMTLSLISLPLIDALMIGMTNSWSSVAWVVSYAPNGWKIWAMYQLAMMTRVSLW